ncbi:MAG: CBS domain-containing protein, partial [Cyanobacteria bacterium P01_H01_bin.121]
MPQVLRLPLTPFQPGSPEHPVVLDVTTSVDAAIRNLHHSRRPFILAKEGDRIVGIWTRLDALQAIASQASAKGLDLRDVLTQDLAVFPVKSLQDPFLVGQFMRERQLEHLACIDDYGDIVGILSSTQLAQVLPTLLPLK